MDKVKVTELGKGTRVILRNGWVATLMDGYKKRSTRLAREEGLLNEIRLIYVSDIGYAEIDEQLYEVEVPENMVSNWSGRQVFPTHVEVNRSAIAKRIPRARFPHARGGCDELYTASCIPRTGFFQDLIVNYLSK